MNAQEYLARQARVAPWRRAIAREDRRRMRYGAAILAVLAGGLAAMVSLSGCGVSKEFKEQVAVASAVGQGRLKKWQNLTPDQHYMAMFEQVRVAADADLVLNGRALPEIFASVAPVGSR